MVLVQKEVKKIYIGSTQIRPVSTWNWDISKATTAVGSFALSWNICYALCLSNDGAHIYAGMYLGYGYWAIREYILSTPYDITTATLNGSINVWQSNNNFWTYPHSLYISEDGHYIYCSYNDGRSGNPWYIKTYTLSTPFNITTASETASLNMGNNSEPSSCLIDEWTRFYYSISDWTYYKELTTPYTLATWTKQNNAKYNHLTISPNWEYLYYVSSNTLKQCSIATPYDVSTTITQVNTLSGSWIAEWYCFDSTGNRLYFIQWAQSSQVIYQYSLT
jgi:hypothetical protein